MVHHPPQTRLPHPQLPLVPRLLPRPCPARRRHHLHRPRLQPRPHVQLPPTPPVRLPTRHRPRPLRRPTQLQRLLRRTPATRLHQPQRRTTPLLLPPHPTALPPPLLRFPMAQPGKAATSTPQQLHLLLPPRTRRHLRLLEPQRHALARPSLLQHPLAMRRRRQQHLTLHLPHRHTKQTQPLLHRTP